MQVFLHYRVQYKRDIRQKNNIKCHWIHFSEQHRACRLSTNRWFLFLGNCLAYLWPARALKFFSNLIFRIWGTDFICIPSSDRCGAIFHSSASSLKPSHILPFIIVYPGQTRKLPPNNCRFIYSNKSMLMILKYSSLYPKWQTMLFRGSYITSGQSLLYIYYFIYLAYQRAIQDRIE